MKKRDTTACVSFFDSKNRLLQDYVQNEFYSINKNAFSLFKNPHTLLPPA